jgi:hypothetical protein
MRAHIERAGAGIAIAGDESNSNFKRSMARCLKKELVQENSLCLLRR